MTIRAKSRPFEQLRIMRLAVYGPNQGQDASVIELAFWFRRLVYSDRAASSLREATTSWRSARELGREHAHSLSWPELRDARELRAISLVRNKTHPGGRPVPRMTGCSPLPPPPVRAAQAEEPDSFNAMRARRARLGLEPPGARASCSPRPPGTPRAC